MPRPAQRCPHCASPKIQGDTCLACGRKVTETPDLPRLEGVETTQLEPRALPKRVPAEGTDKKICSECSVPNPPTRALCLACGKRL